MLAAESPLFLDDMSLHIPHSHSDLDVTPTELLGSPPRENEKRDTDAFLAIRMNDSTSYFFTWFCKHYRIRLQAQATHCPICFEATTNSIELSCGHAFCRKCLVASAAKNFNSCALCRREQVLNPEVLRAQFDERRMINLAKRLRSLGRDIVVPSIRPRPASSTGLVGVRRDGRDLRSPQSAVAARKGSLGTAYDAGDAAAASSSDALSAPLIPRSSSASSSERAAGLGHLLAGPWGDVGAMPADELRKRWRRCRHPAAAGSLSSERAAFLEDVGDASLKELESRWATINALATVAPDVGAESAEELHARLSDAASPRAAAAAALSGPSYSSGYGFGTTGLEDAGALPMAGLRQRWTAVNAAGRLTPDVGAVAAEDLRERWVGAVTFSADDVGSASAPGLRQRWTSLVALGKAGSDASALAEDVGATPAAETSRRWLRLAAAGRLGADAGVEASTDLQERLWNAEAAADDVGDKATSVLAERWAGVVALGSMGADAGAEGNEDLRRRRGLLHATDDVGAVSAGALQERWRALVSIGKAGGDVGAPGPQAVAARWTAATAAASPLAV